MSRKPSKGKCKIDIKRIEDESSRQVAFSKRRLGLFKKASELSIMCGAEMAIIVFSLAGKAFTFGHPSVESVVDRVFSDGPSNARTTINNQRSPQISEINRNLRDILDRVDLEKERGVELKASLKSIEQEIMNKPYEELDLNELEMLKALMGGLKNHLILKAHEFDGNKTGSSPSSILDSHVAGIMDFYNPYNPCNNNFVGYPYANGSGACGSRTF